MRGKQIRLPVALPASSGRQRQEADEPAGLRSPSPEMDAPRPLDSLTGTRTPPPSFHGAGYAHRSALGSLPLPSTLDDLDEKLETISLRSSPSDTNACIDIALRPAGEDGAGYVTEESSSDEGDEVADMARDWRNALAVGATPVTSTQFMEALLRDGDPGKLPARARPRRRPGKKVRRKAKSKKKLRSRVEDRTDACREGEGDGERIAPRSASKGDVQLEDDVERFDREAAVAAALAVDIQTSSLPPPTPSLDLLKAAKSPAALRGSEERVSALGEINSTTHSLNHRIIRGVRKKLRSAQRASVPALDEETICDTWLWIAKVVQDAADGEFEEDDEPEDMAAQSSVPNSPRAVLRRGLAERLAGGELLGAFWAICTRYTGAPPSEETIRQMLGDLSELLYDEMCFSSLHAMSYSSSRPASSTGLDKAEGQGMPKSAADSDVPETRMRARDKAGMEAAGADEEQSESDQALANAFIQREPPDDRQCCDIGFAATSPGNGADFFEAHDYNAAALPLIGSLESSSDEDLGSGLRLGEDLTSGVDVDTPDDDDDNDEEGEFDELPPFDHEDDVSGRSGRVVGQPLPPSQEVHEQGRSGHAAASDPAPDDPLVTEQADEESHGSDQEDEFQYDAFFAAEEESAADAKRFSNPTPVVAFKPSAMRALSLADLDDGHAWNSLEAARSDVDQLLNDHSHARELGESVAFRDSPDSRSSEQDEPTDPLEASGASARIQDAADAVDIDARLDDAIRGLEASLYRESRLSDEANDSCQIEVPSFLQIDSEKLQKMQKQYWREQSDSAIAEPASAAPDGTSQIGKPASSSATAPEIAADPATYASKGSTPQAPAQLSKEAGKNAAANDKAAKRSLAQQGQERIGAPLRQPSTKGRVFSIEVDLEVFEEEAGKGDPLPSKVKKKSGRGKPKQKTPSSSKSSKGGNSAKFHVRWADRDKHHIFDPGVAVASPPHEEKLRKVVEKDGGPTSRKTLGSVPLYLQDSDDIRALELGLQAYEMGDGPEWESD